MSTPKKNKPVKGKQTAKVAAPTMEALIQVIIDLDAQVQELRRTTAWDNEITDENYAGLLARVDALEAAPQVQVQHYQHPHFGVSPWPAYDKSVPYWYAMPQPYTND